MVEVERFELSTLALRTRCSPTELHPHSGPFLRVLDGTLFVNPVILRVPRFIKTFPGKGDGLLEVFDLTIEPFVTDEP
jgi:hypothetical protein